MRARWPYTQLTSVVTPLLRGLNWPTPARRLTAGGYTNCQWPLDHQFARHTMSPAFPPMRRQPSKVRAERARIDVFALVQILVAEICGFAVFTCQQL